MTQDPVGFITIKHFSTFFILLLILIIYIRSDKKHYWAINGLLVSISIFWIIAIQVNLKAVAGIQHMSPIAIIFFYLLVVSIFLKDGYMLNRRQHSRII